MTLFLNCRSQSVGGAVIDPYILEGDAMVSPASVRAWRNEDLAQQFNGFDGEDVLFVAHGFNVSYDSGARSAARLEAALALTGHERFIGVLWPGDFWLPAVNYPFAGEPAMDAGKRIAAFCNTWMKNAASISFVSHSLGARVVLQAAEGLARPAKTVCVTAGAVNSDCLATEYAKARTNAAATTTLASTSDHVLQLAFPLGDLFADLLDFDHGLGTPALGYWGPKKPVPPGVARSRIPQALGYDHGNYMPPGAVAPVPAPPGAPPPDDRWRNVAAFMGRAFRGQTQTWP